jgi:predicted GTPase
MRPHLRAAWARARRFWPESLLAALLALPWLSLFGLGFVWLWQNAAVLWWALGAALLALAGLPLRRVVRRRAADRAAALLGADAFPMDGWNAEERAAWDKVVALAERTEPFGPDNRERVERRLRETVEVVARHFHPRSDRPAAEVTIPELLLLGETVSRRLRTWTLTEVPFVKRVRLARLLWLQDMADRFGKPALDLYRIAEPLYRGARFALSGPAALAQEAYRLLAGSATDFLTGNIQRNATAHIIKATGHAAIELYSGRLTLSSSEIAQAAADEAGGIAVPLRVLLLGQANAGKSSLLNALAGSLRAEATALPGDGVVVEHRVTAPGRPDLVFAELPPGDPAAAVREAQRADIVLWVVAANQAARESDRAALEALRAWAAEKPSHRAPPVLVAMTRGDQLNPKAEWAPPYDPDHPKARSIAAARSAVARSLDLPDEDVTALAFPPGGPPWNVEALWESLLRSLERAAHTRSERIREASGGIDLWAEIQRVGRLGLGVASSAIRRP